MTFSKEQTKRVVIVGAGISGLSLAWYLAKEHPTLDITLIEKKSHAGGWIHTENNAGFLFEQGPHVFKTSRCGALIDLAFELGLRDKMIVSDPAAARRFLFMNKHLYKFPSNPLSFLTSPLMKGLKWALLTEWRKPAMIDADESIGAFATRRFNREVAKRLFDPMVLGIYAGDIDALSVRACFPFLKQWEESYGSVTKGALCSMLKRKKQAHAIRGNLFSFRGGIETLIDTLRRQLMATPNVQLIFDERVLELRVHQGQTQVVTEREVFTSDHVFFATPPDVTAEIISSQAKEAASLLRTIRMQSLTVVNLGYLKNLLPVKGFGYLVPTCEGEDILGTLFDSHIFPSQNTHAQETRLTVMLREKNQSETESLQSALDGMKRHLGITALPTAYAVKKVAHALPQYTLGHLERVELFREAAKRVLPSCTFVGNYLEGASVNQCVASSRTASRSLLRCSGE